MKAEYNLEEQKAIIEADASELKDFIQGIIPDFVYELGGIFSDNVRLWRWQNQVKILKKAKQYLENENLSCKKVSLKVLVPLIESASLEEEDDMQEKWASLLANAILGNNEIKPNYIEILKELSPIEVRILDKLYNDYTLLNGIKGQEKVQFSKQKISKMFPDSNIELIIENFIRLGICRPPGSRGASLGDFPFTLQTTEIFEFTCLGIDFIFACRYENKNKNN